MKHLKCDQTRRKLMIVVSKRSLFLVAGLLIAIFASSCNSTTQGTPSASTSNKAQGDHFNAPGNLLISDQFNNRVVEVAPDGHIVWTFGSGNPTLCNPGPNTIIGLNDAERLSGGLTLTVGTGILAGSQSLPKGCVAIWAGCCGRLWPQRVERARLCDPITQPQYHGRRS